MKGFILSALMCLAITEVANASDCKGIYPKNSRWIGVGFLDEGISQEVFNGVLDKIVAVYNPLTAAQGITLQFNRLWDDGTVNSDTYTDGTTWVINSYGGLARYKGMTADGYAAVACHELGHHLGGAPLYQDGSMMSDEGESDYHVGTKCMRKVFGGDDNIKLMANTTIDPMVLSKCSADFVGNASEIALCERSAAAGFVVADILRDLEGASPIAFNTPDPAQVSTTFDEHPHAQCRLDTYFASSLCQVSADIPFSNTDETVGACMTGDGARPRCWYAQSVTPPPPAGHIRNLIVH